jgi:hypothetical protein
VQHPSSSNSGSSSHSVVQQQTAGLMCHPKLSQEHGLISSSSSSSSWRGPGLVSALVHTPQKLEHLWKVGISAFWQMLLLQQQQ